jgi:hypothetical protein
MIPIHECLFSEMVSLRAVAQRVRIRAIRAVQWLVTRIESWRPRAGGGPAPYFENDHSLSTTTGGSRTSATRRC